MPHSCYVSLPHHPSTLFCYRRGALKYKSTTVKEVMTPLENTFMLSSNEQLSFETLAKIFKTGYSRIPVYSINKVRMN